MKVGLILCCTLVLAGWVGVAAKAGAATYVCVDAQGRKTIQQMPCRDDLPPPPAPPKAKLGCALSADQLRRATRLENQFLTRYPDEAAHGQAQATDVKPVTERIRDAKARAKELAEQRKPLDKEREFYASKPMPSALKSKIDANDAQAAALADILRAREQELVDIQARYQCQRDTYGKMWKGAASGSSACDRPACMPP